VRNGGITDDLDDHMRIMRNELFSMCGLLAEAEGELKVAMERADERVTNTTTAIFGTLDEGEVGETSSEMSHKHGQGGVLKLGSQDYVEFRGKLTEVQRKLKAVVTTCKNCIDTVEDDLGSIAEQVASCDLFVEFECSALSYMMLTGRIFGLAGSVIRFAHGVIRQGASYTKHAAGEAGAYTS